MLQKTKKEKPKGLEDPKTKATSAWSPITVDPMNQTDSKISMMPSLKSEPNAAKPIAQTNSDR